MHSYAVVDGGMVIETIMTTEPSVIKQYGEIGAIDTGSAVPYPQVGWTYADGIFTPPVSE